MSELPLGFRGEPNARELVAGAIHARKQKGKAKSKRNKRGENEFGAHVAQHGLPTFVPQFHLRKTIQVPRKDGRTHTKDGRKIEKTWRFDFACIDYKLIVEIDGGIWMPGGGAHSHPVDIKRNMAKGNDATLCGFFVLRFTPEQVRSRHAIGEVERFLASRGWTRDAQPST